MSNPLSNDAREASADDAMVTSLSKPNGPRAEFFPFGLSARQFARVTRRMRRVVRRVIRHTSLLVEDVVQQAFVRALQKPTEERPSVAEEDKFVKWICTVAIYEALTMFHETCRRDEREVYSIADMTDVAIALPSVGVVDARITLAMLWERLEPEELALLHAHYGEGKTIDDIAREQRLPWTTVDSRHRRLLDRLYAFLQAAVVAVVVLVPKRARAFVANVAQQTPHLLTPLLQVGGATTMTVVCGALLPAGSSARTEPWVPAGLTAYGTPQTTMAQASALQPSFAVEVEPEEPKGLDAETNECSAADMKCTRLTRFLQETAVPLALVVAPATMAVACAGTEQQTSSARKPDEKAEMSDRERHDIGYELYCSDQKFRREPCMTREEWDKRYGY